MLLLVQREDHRVVKRTRVRELVLVEREFETVVSMSPCAPEIPSLKKSHRPGATLHLSTL
jgi:hypothetical protein